MTIRQDRVGDALHQELSDILRRDVRDPRAKLASVASVRVSADLQHARVAISVLGEEEDRLECVEVLTRATGFIRSRLAPRLRLRSVPNLVFELDRGAEHSQRITELLESLHDQHDTDAS
jgi:ribosome-binding factor A